MTACDCLSRIASLECEVEQLRAALFKATVYQCRAIESAGDDLVELRGRVAALESAESESES